jgi:FkbM family methyltransferase
MPPRWIRAAHPRHLAERMRALRRFENSGELARACRSHGAAGFPLQVRMRTGGALTLRDARDGAAAWRVFCAEAYPVPLRARCILDVGAGWGAFSVYAAARAPWARIVALEPHPADYSHLYDQLAANQLNQRVTALKLAVAAEAGAGWMDADRTAPRVIGRSAERPPSTVPVKAVTLLEALDRALAITGADRIGLVKMDIAGAEHDILPHVAPEAISDVDGWVLSYHPSGPKAPLFAALQRAGLRLEQDAEAQPNRGIAYFRR